MEQSLLNWGSLLHYLDLSTPLPGPTYSYFTTWTHLLHYLHLPSPPAPTSFTTCAYLFHYLCLPPLPVPTFSALAASSARWRSVLAACSAAAARASAALSLHSAFLRAEARRVLSLRCSVYCLSFSCHEEGFQYKIKLALLSVILSIFIQDIFLE